MAGNNDYAYIRKIRYAVQAFFLMLVIMGGYMFYGFVRHFEQGSPYVQRPSFVEGFLPIAGMMSFKYFLFTGVIEPLHSAGFFMFVAATAVSLLMKKGFCGWICPVGTVSQYLWMTGEKTLGRNLKPGNYTDIAARSIKYLIMAFFVYQIWVIMTPGMLAVFFESDYYKTADIRTMKFFTGISSFALCFIVVIFGLSLLYKNVWCRYLCPYGALLGLLSLISPVRIKRNDRNCVHCKACSRNCTELIDVEQLTEIRSPECFGCMTCVSHCPSKGALDIVAAAGSRRFSLYPWLFPVILLLLFYLVTGAGMLAGKWNSAIPYDEYQRLIPGISSQETHH